MQFFLLFYNIYFINSFTKSKFLQDFVELVVLRRPLQANRGGATAHIY